MNRMFYLAMFSIFLMGGAFFFELSDFIKLSVFIIFMAIMLFVIIKTKKD